MAYTYRKIDGQRFRSTTEVITTSQIEGLDELIRDIAAFADQAIGPLAKESERAAAVVLERARVLVPKDTHNLERDLHVVAPRTRKGKYIAISKVTFSKNAAYAIPVELGHYTRLSRKRRGGGAYVAARPFLRPAADQKRVEVIDMMIAEMNSLIDKKLGD